ncbi:MAG: hypothetical protein U0641_17100 [Anaerolineae bacterium]
MADVLILVDDLFFSVQIENAARAVGLRPINGPGPAVEDALSGNDLRLVVLDLSLREQPWAEALAQVRGAQPDVPLVAFGPHVDVAARRAAEAAGATRVVTKQQLVADLPGLLRRYAAPT